METPEHRDFVSPWDRVSQTKAIPDKSTQDTFTPRKLTHSWISLSERNFSGVGQYSWRPSGPPPGATHPAVLSPRPGCTEACEPLLCGVGLGGLPDHPACPPPPAKTLVTRSVAGETRFVWPAREEEGPATASSRAAEDGMASLIPGG